MPLLFFGFVVGVLGVAWQIHRRTYSKLLNDQLCNVVDWVTFQRRVAARRGN